eukprot:c23115_g1_i1.p1 GENE.c23115_g1_i1~~c23115_g1_i1.p1  ORF type:complete len:297 (-),score=94.77 c23115_g1_i1:179-1027(-)
MADDWDNDDFEPPSVKSSAPAVKTSWNDDDDDDVADSWDQPSTTVAAAAKPVAGADKSKAKKGSVKAKIVEKQNAPKQQPQNTSDEKKSQTAEEIAAQKFREKQLQEAADQSVISDTFSGIANPTVTTTLTSTGNSKTLVISSSAPSSSKPQAPVVPEVGSRSRVEEQQASLDSLSDPVNDEEATRFAHAFGKRIAQAYETNSFAYLTMLRELLTECCEPLSPEDAKEISLKMSVIYNEKLKASKDKKKPKKKTGPSATGGKKDAFDGLQGFADTNEYDDFM